MGERKAAVPLDRMTMQGDRIVAANLTKDEVKRMGAKWDSVWKRWTITHTQCNGISEFMKYEPRPTLIGANGMLQVAPENAPKA